MTATLLVIHFLLAIALIGVILMQRSSSDGGGLTGGGSSSMGGLMTVRGTANMLTRVTSILATAFIVTSILLTILGGSAHQKRSIADDVKPKAAAEETVPTTETQQSVPAVPLSK